MGTDVPAAVLAVPQRRQPAHEGGMMIILGLILLILGFLFHISVLWTIGIIVLVIGLILALLGASGRAVAGRRHYW
jgi:uncharacterized membrane protein HdeD (DUF308 family)